MRILHPAGTASAFLRQHGNSIQRNTKEVDSPGSEHYDLATLVSSSAPLFVSFGDPKSSRSSKSSRSQTRDPKMATLDPKTVRLVPKTEQFLRQIPLESVFCRSRTVNFRSDPKTVSRDPKTVRFGPKTEQFLRQIPLESVFCSSKTGQKMSTRTDARTHERTDAHT